ncbi:MAG: GatB/YqeY domain-containing protein [bacterium]|nr:GatB/YqeY domain-containing protein [bacterium]
MLKQQLQKEFTEALKSGNQLKRLVLGTLMTAVKNKELAKRGQIGKITNDQRELEQKSQLGTGEVLEVIAGEVKKRRDSIEQFSAGGRPDLVEKEKLEMEILAAYLPEQLSEEKIRNEVQRVIEELSATSPKEMGKVIGAVMAKLKGRADGTLVSKIVKEILVK